MLNQGAPGANLTDLDTAALMEICPFHTLAKEKPSPFCGLFASVPSAFPNFEYIGDLDKFYGTGYVSNLHSWHLSRKLLTDVSSGMVNR